MPDPAWYPQQSDLERKAGGASRLAELSGGQYGDATYVAFVDSCLAIGRGAVRRSVEVKHEPEAIDALDAETTISLRRFATVKAFEAAWNDGTGDLAMPDKLTDEVRATDEALVRIAEGKERLGRASNQPGAALGPKVGNIDPDPQRTGLSVASLREWGFR